MTRYTVEYRRLSAYTNKFGDWAIYSTHETKEGAVESYARHVSNYPAEQARLVLWPDSPDDILFSFDPTVTEEQEDQAA